MTHFKFREGTWSLKEMLKDSWARTEVMYNYSESDLFVLSPFLYFAIFASIPLSEGDRQGIQLP